MRDVATLAGVSPATVSGVLGGTKAVSDITRKKVEAAIAQLGYRPNAVARALRTNESQTIGLVIPDITNPFYSDIAKGVICRAKDYGYGVFLTTTDETFEGVMAAARRLADRRVDGIVLTNIGRDYPMPPQTVEGMPYVLVNRHPDPLPADYAGTDNFGGAVEMADHLLDLGHRAIAFIGGVENSSANQARLDGYLAALARRSIVPDPSWITFGHLRYDEAVEIVHALVHTPVTAIFAGDDMMALGVLDGLGQRGLRVPQDMSVVGFDGIWPTALPGIELTTVSQPRLEIGLEAIELLMDRIKGSSGPPRMKQLPYRVEIRRTTSTPHNL